MRPWVQLLAHRCVQAAVDSVGLLGTPLCLAAEIGQVTESVRALAVTTQLVQVAIRAPFGCNNSADQWMLFSTVD